MTPTTTDTITTATERAAEGDRLHRIAARVTDPEIPVLTIADLGILRDVEQDGDGAVVVTITPTYSGCPATQFIEKSIREALDAAGYRDVGIETRLAPAWTTWPSAVPRPSRAISLSVTVSGVRPGPAMARNHRQMPMMTMLFTTGAHMGAPNLLRAFSIALARPLAPMKKIWSTRNRARITETSYCAPLNPPA